MKKITFQNSLSAITLTLLTMLMAVISTGCSNDSSFDLNAASGSLAAEENEDIADMASQITFLSVWHNKKTDAIYVCVKKATGNNDQGIMLSLESKGTRPDDPKLRLHRCYRRVGKMPDRSAQRLREDARVYG